MINRYRAMWIMATFDLPTDTKQARKDYTLFRKKLLGEGFKMIQYSVYVRFVKSEERGRVIRERIKAFLPPDGEVRIFRITDIQYGKTEIFRGKVRGTPEEAPRQLNFL